MTEELIDILDENGKYTGIVKSENEAHRLGLWHQGTHIWIYNSNAEILFQKRSAIKDSYPGLWDISAAGHVSAGETPKQSGVRELEEEIGITLDKKYLKKIAVIKSSKKIGENFFDNEFYNIYLWRFDGDISKLKLQKEEVESLKWINIPTLESELKNSQFPKKYSPYGKTYYSKIIQAVQKELRKY